MLLQYLISAFFLIYTLLQFQVIYIISGENILTRKLLKLELSIYKLFGKTVVMHFVGADIRNSEVLRAKNKQLLESEGQLLAIEEQTDFQRKLCAYAERYADHILVVSPDLIRFFKREVSYVPVFINIEKFEKEISDLSADQSAKVKSQKVILHAPSNPELKGSAYIEKVLKELKEEEGIEYILTTDKKYRTNINPPYTVTKYDLFRLYPQADLVIDQLLIGWYGMQSLEALLAGKEVLCLIQDDLQLYWDENCPIHKISDAKALKESLKSILSSTGSSQEAARIRSWIQEKHTIEKNQEINHLFKIILN